MARALALLVLGVGIAFFARTPSNDRSWVPEQARLASARVEGAHALVTGIRRFAWRSTTDFDARWEERTIDLERVAGLDVIVSDWGWTELVHTIVSWEIEGERPFAVSIESRREVGETFDPLRGFFRAYELYYAVADEQDLLTLRAVHRHEHVHLYRTSTSTDLARRLLGSYLDAIERLRGTPEFYDSLRHNCSTTVRAHLASLGVEDTWDWRVVLNGHVDELLYARGLLDDSMPLETLRERSDVTERVRELEHAEDFSARVREGLPVPGRATR